MKVKWQRVRGRLALKRILAFLNEDFWLIELFTREEYYTATGGEIQ